MRVLLRTTGVEQAVELLDSLDARLNREPWSPLLEILAQDWASTAQENIRTEAIPLPEHAPATTRIREHYGHGSKGKLIRGGDLVQSIAPLAFGEQGFTVGTEMSFAEVLFSGGEVTEKSGRTHTVPPWPFLVATDAMVADAQAMIADYFTGGEPEARRG